MYDADDDGTRRVAVRGGAAAPFAKKTALAPTSRRSIRSRRARRATGSRTVVAIPRRAVLQLIGALAVLAVAIMLILVAVLRESPLETVRSVGYAGTPPSEWTAAARWQSPPLLPSSGPALVIGTDRVAVLTAERHLLLIDAPTGDTMWSAPLPSGEVATNLAATSVDGSPVVAVQLADRLHWWALDDGSPGELDLPTGSRVTFLGEAPLVGVGPSTVAAIVNRTLVQAEVPAGAVALAARIDGAITTAASAGWWHLRPGATAGPPTPWESFSRNSINPTVISYTGGQIITTLPGKPLRVLVYSDRDNDIRFNFGGIITARTSNSGRLGLTWSPSPSRAWGILSRTLVDLTGGRITDLGDWTTQHVGSDRALGTVGDQQVLVGPLISRGQLVGSEGFPEDLTSAGALVRARENDSETIYLLPPRMD